MTKNMSDVAEIALQAVTDLKSIALTELPFVSIIMPVRNEAKFITANLDRLRRQYYPADKIEIIIADGMSSDGTRDILSNFSTCDPRIRVIDNLQGIVPTGFNAAVKQSRGDIVIRVDGHVTVAHDFVLQNVLTLREHPDAWGCGGPIRHVGLTTCGKAAAAAMSHPLGSGNAKHRFANFEGFGEGAAFPAFHRWVFDRIGYFDENLIRTEDDEFDYRIRRAGGKVYISQNIRASYFVRDRLSLLYRQYQQYSFWRIPVIQKHRRPTTLRQMVPILFYVTMLVLVITGFMLRRPMLALALPTFYGFALAIAGSLLLRKLGWRVAMLLPLAIAVMHAGYASGMIYGIWALCFRPNAWSRHDRMAKLSR